MNRIEFNVPTVGTRAKYHIFKVLNSKKHCGDGFYTAKCQKWFEDKTKTHKALFVTSGTSALDMSGLLSKIEPNDEVIMPSYTFVSTANAFALRGAKIVFVDIRPDTLNIDEELIEKAITKQTKVIVPVHYAGVSCEMQKIIEIGNKYNLLIIEDAAQCMMAKYKGRFLGSIGDLGCYSFHESKNYSCGEGGLLLVNNKDYVRQAQIIREKGTNRIDFFDGKVDKYSWIEIGSSFLQSDVNAALLWSQIEDAEIILKHRLTLWNEYFEMLQPLERKGLIYLPKVPNSCQHNGHMFYIKLENTDVRFKLISFLKSKNINTVFHYIPLHSSGAGMKWGRFHGEDKYTTKESSRILRLPLHNKLQVKDVRKITKAIEMFFSRS